MSLICVHCGKTIVLSDTPDHLAGCSECGLKLTESEQKEIQESSKQFAQSRRQLK